MAPDRLVRIALLPRSKILDTLKACDLFERVGIWTPEEAHAMREAIRARAAELSELIAEAVWSKNSTDDQSVVILPPS